MEQESSMNIPADVGCNDKTNMNMAITNIVIQQLHVVYYGMEK